MSTGTTINVGHKPTPSQTPGSDMTQSDEQVLESIAHGLAESVLEASDEEVLAEVREEGHDPLKKAEEIRSVLLQATKAASSAGTSGRSNPSHQTESGNDS